MRYGESRIAADFAYVLVISDTHIGDAAFEDEGYSKLCENIEWVHKEPNARVFLNGDILNVATRLSASTPFQQTRNLQQQVEFAVKIFTPIKDKIVGAISGNHEQRLQDFVGYCPLSTVCHLLGVQYFGYSAVINFLVGKESRGRGSKIAYTGYFHHTTGGGATPGGKINRVDKLRQLICNCDFYVGSHNHHLGVMPVTTRSVDVVHKRIIVLRQLLIDSGSYLEWDDNYSEAKMFPPAKMGSPRIRLDGRKKDCHVSI